MGESKSFFEIELKALLTKEQYDRLLKELPKKMKLFNEETLHTTRYRPGDIRLRHSDKTNEILYKTGDPTHISRQETVIDLSSKEQLDKFAELFKAMNLKPDPSWIKHKKEFRYKFKGFNYVVCLQHIENFAYILEVEFLSKNDDARIHEPNIKVIFKELGVEPIDPEHFNEKIKKYIKENKA